MDLDDALDELYGCAPVDFVARRRELARSARAEGDAELAREISRARKPTRVAWLLNQWIRRSPTEFDPVLTVADELRQAQRRSSAGLLRELSARRQDVVREAMTRLRSFAADIGAPMSAALEREAIATLRAAIGDEQAAQLLQRGRAVSAMEYSGFGPAGLVALTDSAAPSDSAALSDSAEPITGRTVESADSSDDTSDGLTDTGDGESPAEVREREAREAELAAARAVLDRFAADVVSATAELDVAQRSLDDAEQSVANLADRVRRLRAELAGAEHELRFAQRVVDTAVTQRDAAVVALESASDGQMRARERLDALAGGADRSTSDLGGAPNT
ncbi:hypothetical protein [Gordonia aichiensis]|uniref:Uncharacterized protein n=1 Tax=Gordonia aichiensis NBRC 108223 TaxID=1220583 RepID=L7KQL6_9ACTN|nr:hypothetical protein [Gordonia aichiensis]GAC49973.1 hypothetical protein GOACH_18_00970 [Gordonia aichiensis NBRC 108223]